MSYNQIIIIKYYSKNTVLSYNKHKKEDRCVECEAIHNDPLFKLVHV